MRISTRVLDALYEVLPKRTKESLDVEAMHEKNRHDRGLLCQAVLRD